MELNKPDITLRYGGGQAGSTMDSREIYNTMLHEYGHATHYAGLLAQNKPSGYSIASDYWFQHTKYLRDHEGFGAKTDAGAQRTALIEAWGYFAGNTGNAFKYNNGIFIGIPTANRIVEDEIRQLENAKRDDSRSITTFFDGPGATTYYKGWIPCGLLHDFTDAGEDAFTGINDNVNGYSINGVFKGLRFTNNSVHEYRQQLLFQNGNLQANEVNNLVGQYGY